MSYLPIVSFVLANPNPAGDGVSMFLKFWNWFGNAINIDKIIVYSNHK